MRWNVLGGGDTLPRLKDFSTACGHIGKKRRLCAAIGACLMAGAFSFMPSVEAEPSANALPILDAKDAAVSIDTSVANTMSITSTAANNLIKWVDFSVGKDATVAFGNQNYLNYVTGSARSEIYGTLTGYAGKNIYIVNPNGILIGDGASISVGSLHLSTQTLNATQLASYANATGALSGTAAQNGDVINMGTLNATNITVEGKNITFKNVANVKNATDTTGNTLLGGTNVNLTANGGEIHIGSVNGGGSGYTTSGTTYNYKLVHSAAELQEMNDTLNANYMLNGDINMSGVNDFTPIGNGTSMFSGRFDGLNYQIKNLTINSDVQSVGLFGTSSGVIENVKLVDSNVTGTNSSGVTFIGGIVGENHIGTVRNVSFTGTANVKATGTGSGQYDENWVGGIVGKNTDGTVTYAYNTGKVKNEGKKGYTGGIVGVNFMNQHNATVQYVYNAGEVTNSIDGTATGGIVGKNYTTGISSNWVATVSQAYNTGKISSSYYYGGVGGIVGVNLDGQSISYVYNTGEVKGTAYNASAPVGGIVGKNEGTLTNAYTQSGVTKFGGTAYDVAVGGGSGTATNTDVKTEAALKTATTFAGWDIATTDGTNKIWRIYENSTTPLLTAFQTKKDNIILNAVYDGRADVGTYYKGASTQTSSQAIAWVNDYTFFTTPATLTVSFADTTKTYDGNTTATAGTPTLTGVLGNDDVSVTATATYADNANVGNKTVNYTGVTLTGAKAGNYTITATATGSGTITPKALSLVADPVTITEGGAIPTTFTGSAVGFVTGDGLANAGDLTFALENPTPSAVGSYKVIGTLSGDYGNYDITNAASNNTAFAIVPQRTTPTPQDGGTIDALPPSNSDTDAAKEHKATVAELENETQKPKDAKAVSAADSGEVNVTIEDEGIRVPASMDITALAAQEEEA